MRVHNMQVISKNDRKGYCHCKQNYYVFIIKYKCLVFTIIHSFQFIKTNMLILLIVK